MKEKIYISKGVYEFKPINLYYGRKLIDIHNAKNNLLDFKSIMDSHKVDFGLIYGTLLGAVREGNFIEHDEDIDVFILDENRMKFLEILLEFRCLGFEVARYEKDLLSLIRKDDYIDIYFFRKTFFNKRVCNNDSINRKFLEELKSFEFLGERFKVPKNCINFLELAYGVDWRIPKRNSPAEVKSLFMKIKIFIKRILPPSFIDFLKKTKNILIRE